MASIWQQVKELFERAEESSPAHPAVHELIERSSEEQLDYERWKDTLAKQRLLDWLLDQYAVFYPTGGKTAPSIFSIPPVQKVS